MFLTTAFTISQQPMSSSKICSNNLVKAFWARMVSFYAPPLTTRSNICSPLIKPRKGSIHHPTKDTGYKKVFTENIKAHQHVGTRTYLQYSRYLFSVRNITDLGDPGH